MKYNLVINYRETRSNYSDIYIYIYIYIYILVFNFKYFVDTSLKHVYGIIGTVIEM